MMTNQSMFQKGSGAMSHGIMRNILATLGQRAPGSRLGTHAKQSMKYPTMVTSTQQEIAEHNANVRTRQVVRRETRPWQRFRLKSGVM